MVPACSLRAAYAALLLIAASACDGRLRFLVGLPLVVLALVLSAAALFGRERDVRRAVPPILWMGVAATTALGLVTRNTSGPFWFELLRRLLAAVGVVAVGLVSADDPVWRKRALTTTVAGASLLYALTPLAVPHPQIDVIPWTDAAIDALLAGVHPYTVQAPDVYAGGRDFGFVVRVYPYMPATLLVFAPVRWLLGDFRYALAACLPLTVLVIRRIGRRARVPPALVDAVTLTLALNPVGVLTVRSGWNEPVLGLLAALLTAALLWSAPRAAAVYALLLVALKQYVLAPALLLALGRPRAGWRPWVLAGAVAAITVLPFVAWNARATVDGMLFQMRAPAHPRYTAMSIPGLLASGGTASPPIWLSAATELAVCGAILAARRAGDAGTILLGSAVALLSAFVVGWQAFVNYYTFVACLLLLSAVAAARRSPA